MAKRTRSATLLLLVAPLLFVASATIAGCNGEVRYYDGYYHDYHPWNNGEVVYYNRWETETHHPHMEFKARSDEDKHAYWDWRHSHDHDDHH